MRARRHRAIAVFIASLVLAGCGGKPAASDHDHGDEHAHEEEGAAPATFKEGLGLLLAEETLAALGVETAEVAERSITPELEITASVFDAGPPARASALVPAEVAEELAVHPQDAAKLLAAPRDLSSGRTLVEIILALSGTPAVGTTVSLDLRGAPREGLTVPRSAVLRSAAGDYVYVVNGAHLLRTPVKTGAGDGEYIEIVVGLYTGDAVVTAAVEQLWLTELRLTKGGGHSH